MFRNTNIAYSRGVKDQIYYHKPFSANPYKQPDPHTSWALGWLDAKREKKSGFIYKRRMERYRQGKL